jgi:hypothetical protein
VRTGLVPEKEQVEKSEQRWRRASTIGTYLDAVARLAELILRR